MLPPIHKFTNGLPIERRGSGAGEAYFNDGNRKQAVASGLPSPIRAGYPDPQSTGVPLVGASGPFPPGLDRMAERMHVLERENEHFRQELQHIQHFYSSNQQQHENDKLSVGKIAEDLRRLANSFNGKLQADLSHQQREQQKAGLLFAEVTRLGHRVEGLESELRGVVDDMHRKFETQDQHAQFLASVGSKQQQAVSPSRSAELQRQLRDMQDAMVQLRSELDADRSARWKNDAVVDAKLDAQLERLNSKLAADKRDLAHVLDEQRQLVTGADFQRVASHMREFSRVNDHMLALERWLHSEFGQIKRVFQALAGNVDARFQCVLAELASGLKMWHAAQARQEDEMGQRFEDLEEATLAVAHAMQRKLRTLEEVIPLEVQARQKNDDKLRRRVEGVVKALGHAIETSRGEYLPQQSELTQRMHQLELAQQNSSDDVALQHNAMRETIQAFMEDSDAMLLRLVAAVEQERVKGLEIITAREAATSNVPVQASEKLKVETNRLKEELSEVKTWMSTHALECRQLLQVVPVVASVVGPVAVSTLAMEEMKAEAKRVTEKVAGLQAWTTMHAQECRQFFDFLSWSMDDARRESAIVECLDAVIDQIVETQTCEHFDTLSTGVNSALRHMTARPATVTRAPSLLQDATRHDSDARDDPARPKQYSLQLPDQESLQPEENSTQSPVSEGVTDMLDLSTTTYYASTDGEVAANGERGEEQFAGGVRPEDVVQLLTDDDQESPLLSYASAGCYEKGFGALSQEQLTLQGSLDPIALVDGAPPDALDLDGAVHKPNDDEEDEYSMDMTHDEEVKVELSGIVHPSPAAQQDQLDGTPFRQEMLIQEQVISPSPAEPTPPKANDALDEEEPLTLDL